MHTEPNRSAIYWKLILVATVVLTLLATAWFVRFSNRSEAEVQNLANKTVSTINKKNYEQLERILNNPVATQTLRNEVENKHVHLGQVEETDPHSGFFTVLVPDSTHKEVFIYVTKNESGSWWASIP
ncbi:hypothetical protein QS713_01210 [Gleimia hominis]|uniref:Uncharacterized protein n=1 Tax=Gleimia hominis TaxID=595468 RepID=A0ABU3I9R9_9ACTO|nr:hypothetical protein [Gleimia hominis]MDT3766686.1 hypothetical protein [Gleimia hominis]